MSQHTPLGRLLRRLSAGGRPRARAAAPRRLEVERLEDRLVPSGPGEGGGAGGGGDAPGGLVGPMYAAAQSITFTPPSGLVPGRTYALAAQASSGLPVTRYEVVSGPAVISNYNLLLLTGPGAVTVKAVQEGNATWAYAEAVRTFGAADLTPSLRVLASGLARQGRSTTLFNGTLTITNTSRSQALTAALRVVLTGLTPATGNAVNRVTLGKTNLTSQVVSLDNGAPVLVIPASAYGSLAPGASLTLAVQFYLVSPLNYVPRTYRDL